MTTHANSQHGLSCRRLISNITDRKASAQGQLKGETRTEGLGSGYRLVQSLNIFHGCPPDISNEYEGITAILEGLFFFFFFFFFIWLFNHEECEEATKSLAESKCSGEDNIPPEVFIRCDLDDIVLDICNEALSGRERDQTNGQYFNNFKGPLTVSKKISPCTAEGTS